MTATPLVLGLSEAQLHHSQEAFKPSYHLNCLQICQQFVPLRGLDVLEVGGTLPASLMIDHLGCNSWTAVEPPAYDQELGAANQFHHYLQDQGHQQKYVTSYKQLCHHIEIHSEDYFGKFDLIFSIACFERIHRLPQALRAMHRCLKHGGSLFTMHSPIWNAFDEPHLPTGIPARFEGSQSSHDRIFRPWKHLLLTRAQAFKVLQRHSISADFPVVAAILNSKGPAAALPSVFSVFQQGCFWIAEKFGFIRRHCFLEILL
jgi:SAM-dependent methyltransferase